MPAFLTVAFRVDFTTVRVLVVSQTFVFRKVELNVDITGHTDRGIGRAVSAPRDSRTKG